MDFEKYKIRMNVRSCCLFEQLTGKNFFQMSDGEDMLQLMYAVLVANNDLMFSYDAFLILIQDPKVFRWLEGEYKRITDFSSQLKVFDNKNDDTDGKKDESNLTMTEIASSLIVQYHLDPHYVMNEMQLWEIMPYFKVADAMTKAELVEKRFWTYMNISPHINTKKCSSPEDLIAFEWEKKKKREEFNKNAQAAAAFLGGNTEVKNAEQ